MKTATAPATTHADAAMGRGGVNRRRPCVPAARKKFAPFFSLAHILWAAGTARTAGIAGIAGTAGTAGIAGTAGTAGTARAADGFWCSECRG